jgi:hypothetical protein
LRDLFPDFGLGNVEDLDEDEVPDLVAGDVNFEEVATGDAQ